MQRSQENSLVKGTSMRMTRILSAGHGVPLVAMAILSVLSLPGRESLPAQERPSPDWSRYDFLAGEWIAEAAPAEPTGGFTWAYDLRRTILVRRNTAVYAATKDRPAFTHNDLMILYQEAGKTRAVYFDNERHVINYTVSIAEDSSAVVFISDPSPSAPRFRLTHSRQGTDRVAILFEIAPPGKPEAFAKYIEAFAHRK